MLIPEGFLMKINKMYSLLLVLPLVGCNSLFTKHVKCDDEAALGLVTKVLQDDLEKSLDSELKALIGNRSIKDLDPAKLKLSAKNIQFALTDSRTDFIDPNSPKTTCSIDLVATIPSDLIKKSDLILVMSQNQQKHIEQTWPFSKGKTFRLGHWQGKNVPDPYQHEQSVFDDTCQLIQTCINDWKKHI